MGQIYAFGEGKKEKCGRQVYGCGTQVSLGLRIFTYNYSIYTSTCPFITIHPIPHTTFLHISITFYHYTIGDLPTKGIGSTSLLFIL